jgi:hypothetical protein
MSNGWFLSEREPISGPLLPNGKFQVVNSRPLDGYRKPVERDWKGGITTKPKTHWEPVPLPLRPLTKSAAREISSKPSRVQRRKFPVGEYDVYPRRNCVLAFQRRAFAMRFINEALPHLDEIDDSLFFEETIHQILNMLPIIGRELISQKRSTIDRLRNRLGYFLRKSKFQDHLADCQEGSSSRAPHF